MHRHFQEDRDIKGSWERHLFTSICARAGDNVNAQRAGLSGDNVDMLVFLKKNLRVQNELLSVQLIPYCHQHCRYSCLTFQYIVLDCRCVVPLCITIYISYRDHSIVSWLTVSLHP